MKFSGDIFDSQGSDGSVNYSFRSKICIAIIYFCFSDYYVAMKDTKEELEAIKITGLNGENTIDCSIKVISLAKHLDREGAFEPNFLCNIVNIFETTTDKQFELWNMRKFDESSGRICKLSSLIQVLSRKISPRRS